MFQSPPGKGSVGPWLLAGAWSLFIFSAIPFSRPLLRAFDQRWGAASLRWLVLACLILAALGAAIQIARRLRRLPWDRWCWLAVTLGLFTYLVVTRRSSPAEALHFVEYGLLGILVFHALRPSIRDYLIYPSAVVICLQAGTVDEILQWLTPGRFWDMRDIGHNGVAALLIQVAIAGGLRPPCLGWPPSPRSVRRLGGLTALLLLLLGACASHTPVVVATYVRWFPSLAHLEQRDHPMSEYGYRHDDPEIGRFYSRFTLEDLARTDQVRGTEAGAIIARYWSHDTYSNFLQRYTPARDPFVHEANVHMFRRNHYQAVLWKHRQNAKSLQFHANVAYRENQLLERYFPVTLAASGQVWPPEESLRLKELAGEGRRYTSPVSIHLITRVRERQVWMLIAGLLLLDLMVCLRWGRDPRKDPRAG